MQAAETSASQPGDPCKGLVRIIGSKEINMLYGFKNYRLTFPCARYVMIARQTPKRGKESLTTALEAFYANISAHDSRRAFWITLEDFKNGSTSKLNSLLDWIGFSGCQYTKVHLGATKGFTGEVKGQCTFRSPLPKPTLLASSRERRDYVCTATPVEEPLCDPCRGDHDFVFIMGASDIGRLVQTSLNQIPSVYMVGERILSGLLKHKTLKKFLATGERLKAKPEPAEHYHHKAVSMPRQQCAWQSLMKARIGAFNKTSTFVIGSRMTDDLDDLNFQLSVPCARFIQTSEAIAWKPKVNVSRERIFRIPVFSTDVLNELLVWIGFSGCHFRPSAPGQSTMPARIEGSCSYARR